VDLISSSAVVTNSAMGSDYQGNPLAEPSLAELRQRRSVKWRAYPPEVLPLWVAEMDVRLAPPIRRRLLAAIETGDTGYVGPSGIGEAFSRFALERFGWTVEPAACVVVPDVMRGIAAVLDIVTAPGDGVVINPPVYPPFFSYVEQAGRKVVASPMTRGPEDRWEIDFERLERDFARPEVTAYLMCNPQNPTGTSLTRTELGVIAELSARHGVRVLVDEIHAPLTYPGSRFTPFLSLDHEGAARAVAFTSASKAWNLAGLKTAIIVAGTEAVPEVAPLSRQVSAEAGLFGVLAAEVAFTEGTPWLNALLAGLDANRRLLARLLAETMPSVHYRVPDATFLAWLDCEQLGLGGNPAKTFLKRGQVALNPGHTFGEGGSGHVRLNFATSAEILATAVRQMAASAAEQSAYK
jgi:cystathionine beta-lyase